MSDINYIVNDFKVIPRLTDVTQKLNLVGQTREQLKEKLTVVGVLDKQLNMRVKQIWQWIYFRGV
jgi:23S rRNA (adenine2503-C2)-methyltransferase